MRRSLATLAVLVPLVSFTPPARGERADPFASSIAPDSIDRAATADWVDGRETSRADFLRPVDKWRFPNQVAWFLAMPGVRTGWDGISFGASIHAGPRHLRVGFLRPVRVGTVLTRGDIDRVSVLRADAAYPGAIAEDAQWIDAVRGNAGDIAFWVLPPGTTTRALRFSTTKPASREPTPAVLTGAAVFVERFVDVAPAATALASSHAAEAARLNDARWNGWQPWDDDAAARTGPITRDHPEWAMLVWPKRVSLRGLGVLFPFLGTADVQVYEGPDAVHPREADERSWRTLATPSFVNAYPHTLEPTWIDFGRNVTTRAVRLRIVAPIAVEGHQHEGKSRGGKRVSIDEIMAIAALGGAPVPALAAAPSDAHPPIAVPFTMPAAGYATLVIEDAGGRRVRNLVADTWFGAGPQVAWWDGLDESGRIDGPQHGAHGLYTTVGVPVAPGAYHVRGLYHGPLPLSYEMSVYSPGNPPWPTTVGGASTGGWLSDHGNPSAVLFLPGASPRLLIASPIAEAGQGIIWTDRDGTKLGGLRWIGGAWTGASHLARDAGPRAARDVVAYTGVSWSDRLRLTAIREQGEPTPVAADALAAVPAPVLGGLAARDGVVLATLPKSDRLVRVDAARGVVLDQLPLPDGRGLTFDARGRLLVLSGRRLLAFEGQGPPALAAARVLVASGLEDPRAIATDARGDIYVGDWGASHQVKVFDAAGRLLRVIGRAGGAVVGPYDERRMNRPAGLTVTDDGRLWVAEDSWAPKRVSVWTTEGAFVRAFYGPPQYGGGGALDPKDPTRFYYAGQGQRTGLEFALDWSKGTSSLRSIYWLPDADPDAPPGDAGPQTPIYVGGRLYMTDAFNTRPVGGAVGANVWLMRDGRAVRVAALGPGSTWPLLRTAAYLPLWPAGIDPVRQGGAVNYTWSDLNGDGRASPDEVTLARGGTGSVTVNDRLEITTAFATVFAPEGFTPAGAPIYDARHGHPQAGPGFFMREVYSGSGSIMALRDGWTFVGGGPVRGFRGGVQRWTYPNEWPSQHAGLSSTSPPRPGQLMATTRLMSPTIRPVPGKVGGDQEIVAINGDAGVVFLMTADGLFVATLFHDMRETGVTWSMREATRGMRVDDLTLYSEAFWTTVAQTQDGSVFVIGGSNHIGLVRVGGLETLRALTAPDVEVTPAALKAAEAHRAARELDRQRRVGRDVLAIPVGARGVAIDGDLADWRDATWVEIADPEGPLAKMLGRVEAAAAVDGPRLCLAFRTKDPGLLSNTGEAWRMSFSTGGALDLMLGTDAGADPLRSEAVPGDLRLLVTRAAGKTRAVLYRPKTRGHGHPASFSSPWRTVTMDDVVDVSDAVTLAQKGGDYEVSVPLATLGLRPRVGLDLRGDVGVLRGDGRRTLQRLYWQNKSTSTVSDLPTEATLTPALWGRLRFVAPPARPDSGHD